VDAIRFRAAIPGDGPALGAMHVASWRETYIGILPDELLASLSVDARAEMWTKILCDPEAYAGTEVYVAEDRERLVAFGSCGRQRDEALAGSGFSGEIGAVYVLRSHQHRGIGRSIMSLMANALLESGHRAATLWVLRENLIARKFYESLGGTIAGEQKEERPDATLFEVAYGWSDLSALVR
jgi:ribosomal protein S18 acetylase RimI-like enzyme